MSRGFCHLNLHTDRSQFVGMIKPAQIVDWSKRNGLSAVAITDHDNISAAVELYKNCKIHNLKPIYGMEVSVSLDKTKRERGSKNLVLIAKNITGFKNLVILSTIGSMFFYYRPRVDMRDIKKYSEGLIALTACLNGLTAGRFFAGGDESLLGSFNELYEIFSDDLYLEIQPTLKDPQRAYNEACNRIATGDSRVKLIATGDPHYLDKEDAQFHEHFMRIKIIGSKDGDWKYPFAGPYHVRNYDEMVEQFADLHGYDVTAIKNFKDAMDRPAVLAESIDRFDIKEGVRIPTLLR